MTRLQRAVGGGAVPRCRLSVIVLALGVGSSAGCAAKTLQFVRPGEFLAGRAVVHVMKTEKFQGGGAVLEVFDGPLYVGDLGPSGYLSWSRPAGRAELYAYYPGREFIVPVPLVIDLKPGAVHYVAIETALVSNPRVVPQEITEQRAVELMRSRKPAPQGPAAKPFDEAFEAAGSWPGPRVPSVASSGYAALLTGRFTRLEAGERFPRMANPTYPAEDALLALVPFPAAAMWPGPASAERRWRAAWPRLRAGMSVDELVTIGIFLQDALFPGGGVLLTTLGDHLVIVSPVGVGTVGAAPASPFTMSQGDTLVAIQVRNLWLRLLNGRVAQFGQ